MSTRTPLRMKILTTINYRMGSLIKSLRNTKLILVSISTVILISLAFQSCNQKGNIIKNSTSKASLKNDIALDSVITVFEPMPIDSELIDPFLYLILS